ncbi:MAG: T9SS type A sorting domain-containing protein [Prevotella sp.]
MTKYLYTIIFSLALTLAVPSIAYAEPVSDDIEHGQTPSVSVVEGSQLRVTNANGQVLRVYNVTGVQVRVFKVDGMDRCYDLNLPKGCYIIKVGKTVRKISIR